MINCVLNVKKFRDDAELVSHPGYNISLVVFCLI